MKSGLRPQPLGTLCFFKRANDLSGELVLGHRFSNNDRDPLETTANLAFWLVLSTA